MNLSLEGVVALLGSTQALSSVAPDLHVGGAPSSVMRAPPREEPDERRSVERHGFGALRGAVDERACAALTRGIIALRERSLPATFVYAFDEPWILGEHVRQRVSDLLGHDYRLVEDVWAWHVPPGAGGWPPHRGIYDVHLERAAPEIINTWIALSDAPADRACMHVVPLDEDPNHPSALERLDAPLSAVRAMPAACGDLLLWNANVLHWGGRCAEQAAGPRVSCSFTLCRSDAVDRFGTRAMLGSLAQLDLHARLEIVADMVATYGATAADVSDAVRQWAALTLALRSRFGREGSGLRKAP